MADDTELLSFKIDAWTPETIPMARLAEYMRAVATLYGEHSDVHFKTLKRGSAVIVSSVRRESFPKVIVRLQQAKGAAPPEEIGKAYDTIDHMLRRDNAIGVVSRKGGKVIDFPGRRAPEPEVITLSQPTSVDGVVVRIGGVDDTIPLVLQDAEGVTYHCNIRGRDRAREFAKYLYGAPIRVSGSGRWTRTTEGKWELENLNVTDFEELDTRPLGEVVGELRAAAKGAWDKDSLERWKQDRED